MRPGSLVVFSHLRWDFVFQRPQHIMTRMAAIRPVIYIEEPVHTEGASRWEMTTPVPGVTICRPLTSIRSGGFSDEQNAVLTPMVEQLIADHAGADYDLWFYSPLALPLADRLTPRVTVFDNMDDLSAFKFAPPQLREREQQLLDRSDVVFTGGPSLYRAMKGRHTNVHCFSSSVDISHFSSAAESLTELEEQADIPHPRLGFFGVIDERFDIPLLESIADARPDWHFVIVGPVVKIDPETLPARPNIHYTGGQTYAKLPAFLSGWDVALLLFARNESTKRISPTKVLEYMAAKKPIVSTRITDIVEPYGTMVGLGDDPSEFLEACERALEETPETRAQRLEQYEQVLSQTSWNATTAAMSDLIEAAALRAQEMLSPEHRPIDDARETNSAQAPVVIIGAGPTGLSAAYHIGERSVLLEANTTVGGWCRSLVDSGFTFDWAGHIMFSNDSYVHEMYKILLGDNVHWQDREAWIYSKNVYTRYPFQGSLYGLPADVIKECIVGAIESRFGAIHQPASSSGASGVKAHAVPQRNGVPHTNGNGHTNGHANGNGWKNPSACVSLPGADPKDAEISDCCGDGVAESTLKLVAQNGGPSAAKGGEPKNFEEFIYKVWGAGIAKHFAIPYNRKIWAVPLTEMETSWLGGRVPMPDLEEMIEGALAQKPKPMGPNARFGYPLRGGFQALMDGFLPHLKGEVRLNCRVKAISVVRQRVTLNDGTEIPYEQLISTMPLPSLIKSISDHVPAEVIKAVEGLRYTSVRCVNIGVGREALTEKHWIYYPEDTVFHRIFVQGNASPHCNPPGGFGLTCEITYGPLKPLPCDGQELIERCIAECMKVGLFDDGDPIMTANQVDMPFAYVVYDHARPHNVAVIRKWLEQYSIHLAGRYSEWEYYNSDHAFIAGKRVAGEALARLSGPLTMAGTQESRPTRLKKDPVPV